jgi:hypothetical protein
VVVATLVVFVGAKGVEEEFITGALAAGVVVTGAVTV